VKNSDHRLRAEGAGDDIIERWGRGARGGSGGGGRGSKVGLGAEAGGVVVVEGC